MSKRKGRSWATGGGGKRYKQSTLVPSRYSSFAGARKRRASRMRMRNYRSAGFLGIETKFFDSSLATTLTAPTDCTGGEVDPGTLLCLTCPAQGDGESNRDGKQICMKYLEINGRITTDGVEAVVGFPSGTEVYVACVLDTQTNAAQLNSEDVFKNTLASAATATAPQRNLLFGKRFRILKQGLFNLSMAPVTQQAANDYSMASVCKSFKWFIPLKMMKVNFNSGTTSVIANVIDNSVHLIAFANQTTTVPRISYNARLRFIG